MDKQMVEKCSNDIKVLELKYEQVTREFIKENSSGYHAPIAVVLISALFNHLKSVIICDLYNSTAKNCAKIVERIIYPNLNILKEAGNSTLRSVIDKECEIEKQRRGAI